MPDECVEHETLSIILTECNFFIHYHLYLSSTNWALWIVGNQTTIMYIYIYMYIYKCMYILCNVCIYYVCIYVYVYIYIYILVKIIVKNGNNEIIIVDKKQISKYTYTK